jgi:hypothetical protein
MAVEGFTGAGLESLGQMRICPEKVVMFQSPYGRETGAVAENYDQLVACPEECTGATPINGLRGFLLTMCFQPAEECPQSRPASEI